VNAAAPDSTVTASFRDPGGRVFAFDGRIYRLIHASGAADFAAYLDSKAARRAVESGHIVTTRVLDATEAAALRQEAGIGDTPESQIVEHQRIPFASFPYEWPPEMLHAAGILTVDLARELLAEGLGLKDGTPYNVLFRGAEPVFVDVLSIERRRPGNSTWLPYAQFVRTFLLPLLASGRFGVPLDQIFLSRRDGLEPEEVYRWLGRFERLRPPFLPLVSMPVWLGSRHKPDDASIYRKTDSQNAEKARFVLEMLLKRLRRSLDRLAPAAGRRSAWSGYMTSNNNYAAEQFAAKSEFVEGVMKEFRPRRVLDAGCNTGYFGALAARCGASVVAIDYDPAVVGEVWRQARKEKLDILPLTVNLTRPSPGTGWRNQECPSFLDRAAGQFDAVFMLAVIHHMQVTERVPLPDILDLAAQLTTKWLVIEFIAPEDSMFRRLTRGREGLHADLNVGVFEAACAARYEIVRKQHAEGSHRWLYLLRLKSPKARGPVS
jgi:SAM-dependent methyltransferase